MKSLNQAELQAYIDYWGSHLVGAQLQDVWTDGEVLVLELRRPTQTGWLCLDLRVSEPLLIWVTKKPPVRKQPKPVALFLAAHAENHRLQRVHVRGDQGRVVEFLFGTSSAETCLVFLMIPKFVNVSVFAQWEEEKKGRVRKVEREIHWNKPRDLPESTGFVAREPSRFWEQESEAWAEAWWQDRFAGSRGTSLSNPDQALRKALGKKSKALQAIRDDLAKEPERRWRELGERLKDPQLSHQEFSDLYDSRKTRSENMTKAFAAAKEAERKSKGKRQRTQLLEAEILQLQEKLAALQRGEPVASPENPVSRGSKAMQQSEARGRKHVLPSGLEVVMGRSARDNLQILRQARAWDLWLHLRDYPGAHAIIFREKSQTVSDADLALVGTWIWQQTKGISHELESGLRLDLLVAEARFVRPVKGSPGLVTHQNARVLTFRPIARV